MYFMQETWKQIPGYIGLYEASDFGNIRTLRFTNSRGIVDRSRDRIMKQQTDKNGYKTIGLRDFNGIKKRYFVHRLIGITFNPNPLNLPEINHYDTDKSNNNIDNLIWCSGRDNLTHYYDKMGKQFVGGSRVNKIDEAGNIIATYTTLREAGEMNNIKPADIGRMIKGQYKLIK